MAKNSFSIRFYPYTRKGAKGKTVPIYCRITIDRKKCEFKTGKVTTVSKWDSSKQEVRGDRSINSFLIDVRKNLDSIHSELLKEGEVPTAALIRDRYLGSDEKSQLPTELVSFFTEEIKRREKLPEENSKATINIYRYTLDFFKEYLANSGRKTISLSKLNHQEIDAFSVYLKSDKGQSVNTANKYLKKLKAVLNRARKFDLIAHNPFEHYKIKNTSTDPVYLTREELTKLRQLSGLKDHLKRSRDIFVFAVYTGLRYSDVSSLRTEHIETDEDGMDWIVKEQEKTGQVIRIPIVDEAKSILRQYNADAEDGQTLLPVISNQKINGNLHEICKRAGIKKSVSFHSARHTFGTTIASEYEIPIDLVSKWLGHRKLSTTLRYKQITDNSLRSTAVQINEKSKEQQQKYKEGSFAQIADITWERFSGEVKEEEKTNANVMKWLILPLVLPMRTLPDQWIPANHIEKDSIELKKAFTIQLDLLELGYRQISDEMFGIDLGDIDNLNLVNEKLSAVFQMDEQVQISNDPAINMFLNMRLAVAKKSMGDIVARYCQEKHHTSTLSDQQAILKKWSIEIEMKKLNRELQLELFPNSEWCFDLKLARSTASRFQRKLLEIVQSQEYENPASNIST